MINILEPSVLACIFREKTSSHSAQEKGIPKRKAMAGKKIQTRCEKQPIGKDFKYHIEYVNFTVYMQNLQIKLHLAPISVDGK